MTLRARLRSQVASRQNSTLRIRLRLAAARKFQINTRLKPETVVAAGEKFELAQSLSEAFDAGAGLIEADLIKLGVPINIVEDVIRSSTAPQTVP